MLSIYRILFFTLLLCAGSSVGWGQTLSAGDIAFLQYNGDGSGTDVKFLALKDIPAGEVISFTDRGWRSSGSFRTGEGTFNWTSPSGGISCGEVVTFTEVSMDFSAGGDQCLAYQGSSSSPSFIAAIQMNGNWDSNASDSHTSAIPTGLVNGTNCLAIDPEVDNAKYNGTLNGSIATIRAAINNQDNWMTNNTTPQNFTGSFTISDCGSSTTPTITITPSSLTGFTYVEGSGPSGVQSFNITGSNLTGAVTLTLSNTNYEWSANMNGPFNMGDIIINPNGNGDINDTYYVRLVSGLTQGTYNGGATASSSGAANQSISFEGSVTSATCPTCASSTPTNLNPGDVVIAGFDDQTGSGPDDEFTLVTFVDIGPGTEIIIANASYEAQDPPSGNQCKWFESDGASPGNLDGNVEAYSFTNNGSCIAAGSKICFNIGTAAPYSFTVNGNAHNFTIAGSGCAGGGTVNISASHEDAIFLLQGTWDCSNSASHAYFQGDVLHGLMAGGNWSTTTSGDLSNGYHSRIPPQIDCIESQDTRHEAFYNLNQATHSVTDVTNSANWGASSSDCSSCLTTAANNTSCSSPVCAMSPANAGDIVVTEILQNPSPNGNGDPDGEWFEIYNTTGVTLDLDGCVITSNSGGETHTINMTLEIASGDYAVLSNETQANNGGIATDYVYGNDILLTNSADDIAITCGGTLIDQVIYDAALDFPVPNGASMTLDPNSFNHIDNDNATNWCEGQSTSASGDLGTPGAANDICDYGIVLNEIHYNPATAQGFDNDYEFIELYNRTAAAVDVSGWTFTDGLDYTFPNGTIIPAGGYLILANNTSNYPGSLDWGGSSSLSNGGETIVLETAASGGLDVFSVTYGDEDGASGSNWPDCADGRGPSLSIIDNTLKGSALYDVANWAPSSYVLNGGVITSAGTPGSMNDQGCCLIIAASVLECDDVSNQYNARIYFADAADTRDVFTLTNNTGSGTIAGDDPNTATAGTIEINDISTNDNYNFTITSSYGCSETFSETAPNCDNCELGVTVTAVCTNEDTETYSLEVDVNPSNPLSNSATVEIDGAEQGSYQYSAFPVTFSPFTSTYRENVPVKVTDDFSEPKLTITALHWQQASGNNCDESVTITNTGEPVDLNGYKIGDDFAALFGITQVRHTFSTSTVLNQGESLTITIDNFDPNGDGDLSDQECPIFNNSGDVAVLYNTTNNPVSAITYDDGASDPTTQDALDPTAYCIGEATYDEPCDASILPVEFLYFQAEKKGEASMLTWATSTELNNAFFEVERSTDALQWETIGHLQGAGTTTFMQEYELMDYTPHIGFNYYRLKQVDKNGGYTYSEIRSLHFSKSVQTASSVQLVPTLTDGQMRLVSSKVFEHDTDAHVIDMLGRRLMQFSISAGTDQLMMDVHALPAGSYILRLPGHNLRFVRQ